MLYLLAGLDRPDEGEIEVAGARIDRMTEDELTLHRRRRVGVVFQQYNLLPTLTALENAMLPGVLDGRPRAELESRARELLGHCGGHARAHDERAAHEGHQAHQHEPEAHRLHLPVEAGGEELARLQRKRLLEGRRVRGHPFEDRRPVPERHQHGGGVVAAARLD
ncbi:MAG: ATP-binding cassette domain-containing protein [Phycisphaerales bacterium]